MSGVRVTVEFTHQQDCRLQRLAASRGQSIAELVYRSAVEKVTAPPRVKGRANNRGRVDTLLDKIARLHEMGFDDDEMTQALGCDRQTVRRKRIALGLRSNARRHKSARKGTN